jgi:hypothetical protein
MARIAMLLALSFGFALTAHAGSVIHVADGDCAALADAVSSAPDGQQTTLVLARKGRYHSVVGTDCGIHLQRGNVLIEASGATIDSAICASEIIGVEAGAALTLRDALVQEPDCGLGNGIGASVVNDGTLQFDAVTLLVPSAVQNHPGASMTLRNVTLQSNMGLGNGGSLDIFNSTLQATDIASGGSLVLANSVLATPPGACAVRSSGTVQSLGGNIVGASCTWAIATDRRATDYAAGLGAVQDNGGLVATAAPASASIVRDAGVAKYCEPTDARGIVRPAGACDAGAVEFDARKSLGEGGMNGIFYDRAANGHYVTIQRVHDDGTALVIWNTFDRNGDQAWIYGVGQVSGRHIHIEMSQNLGGRLQAGGAPVGSSVHSWGTVDIDLTSCLSGTLRYASPLAEFGSGQFPLDRLATVSAFGCAD